MPCRHGAMPVKRRKAAASEQALPGPQNTDARTGSIRSARFYQGRQIAFPAGSPEALAGEQKAYAGQRGGKQYARETAQQYGGKEEQVSAHTGERAAHPPRPQALPEGDGQGVGQIDSEGQTGTEGQEPSGAPCFPVRARQQENGSGEQRGKHVQIALEAFVIGAGAPAQPPGAPGDDEDARQRNQPQDPPGGQAPEPGQPGSQQKVAQIAADQVYIQGPVDVKTVRQALSRGRKSRTVFTPMVRTSQSSTR